MLLQRKRGRNPLPSGRGGCQTKAMNSLEKLAKAHSATQRQVLEALLSTFKDDLFLNEKLAEIGKKPHKVAKKAKTT